MPTNPGQLSFGRQVGQGLAGSLPGFLGRIADLQAQSGGLQTDFGGFIDQAFPNQFQRNVQNLTLQKLQQEILSDKINAMLGLERTTSERQSRGIAAAKESRDIRKEDQAFEIAGNQEQRAQSTFNRAESDAARKQWESIIENSDLTDDELKGFGQEISKDPNLSPIERAYRISFLVKQSIKNSVAAAVGETDPVAGDLIRLGKYSEAMTRLNNKGSQFGKRVDDKLKNDPELRAAAIVNPDSAEAQAIEETRLEDDTTIPFDYKKLKIKAYRTKNNLVNEGKIKVANKDGTEVIKGYSNQKAYVQNLAQDRELILKLRRDNTLKNFIEGELVPLLPNMEYEEIEGLLLGIERKPSRDVESIPQQFGTFKASEAGSDVTVIPFKFQQPVQQNKLTRGR